MSTFARASGRADGGEEVERLLGDGRSTADGDDEDISNGHVGFRSSSNGSIARYEGVIVADDDGATSPTSTDAMSVDMALQRVGLGRYQYMLCVALGWALSADAVEVLAVSFLLPFAMCELQASSLEKGALSAVGFAGMLLGSVIWGAVADGIGRQRALLCCQSLNAVFAIASSFTQDLPYLIVTRLFSGIGVGGTLPLLSVYFIEFLPPQNRGRWMGFYVCFWMIGQFLISGLAWIVLPRTNWGGSIGGFRFNSWRIFLLLAAIPCSTSALMFLALPETPFYLVQEGRIEEAFKVFRRIFVVNNRGRKIPAEFPSLVVIPATDMAATYAAGHHSRCSGFLKGVASRVAALCTNRRHRTPFLLSSTVFFCIGFSSYGLSMWFPELFRRLKQADGASVCSIAANHSNSDEQCDTDAVVRDSYSVFFDTFLQAVATVPGNVIFLCIVDVVGRKLILGGSLLLSSGLVLLMWFASSHALGVGAAMGFTAISTFSWNSITLIAPLLFTTDLRSTAQGLQTSMIRLASVAANLVVGATIDSACSYMMLLMGAALVIGAGTSVFLPNTAKRELS